MANPYPDFYVGGVYEFGGPGPKKDYGQWTVSRIDGYAVYATGDTHEFRRGEQCMVHINMPERVGSAYSVIAISDEPVIEEDWT